VKIGLATVPGFLLAVLLPFYAAAADRPDCEPDLGSCAKKIGKREIVFEITPKPVKAMQELVFSLRVSPDVSAQGGIVIDLSMPGMYMGKNRVLLARSPDGTYSGKGVIPKCRSGRKLWKAAADIPGAGKVDFSFNVSY
jgi:hypothetical protein